MSARLPATVVENVVIGGIYCVVTLTSMLMYGACMFVMWTNAGLWKSSCIKVCAYVVVPQTFKIMFHMGICDMITLIVHFLFGAFTMLNLADVIPHSVDALLANFLEAFAWFPVTTMMNLLGLNRLLVFVSAHWSQRLFSPKMTCLWICLSWVYGCGWFFYYTSHRAGMIYYWDSWGIYFDFRYPVETALKLGLLNNYIHFTMSPITFALMWIMLRKKHNNVGGTNCIARRRERSLALQASCICVVYWLCTIYFNNSYLIPGLNEWRYKDCISSGFWIATATMNPAIYLTLNITMRENVCRLFKRGTGNNANTIHPSMLTAVRRSTLGQFNI